MLDEISPDEFKYSVDEGIIPGIQRDCNVPDKRPGQMISDYMIIDDYDTGNNISDNTLTVKE